jgi:hypothetical protein
MPTILLSHKYFSYVLSTFSKHSNSPHIDVWCRTKIVTLNEINVLCYAGFSLFAKLIVLDKKIQNCFKCNKRFS